jgi:hypothetical protein
MSMLGHLVHNQYGADEAPVYHTPKGDSWVRRAWRAMFGRRNQSGH